MSEQSKDPRFGVVRSAESERRRVAKNPRVASKSDKFSLTSQNVSNLLWLAMNKV